MYGMEDFLLGNMMPNFNFNNQSPAMPPPANPGMPQQPMGFMANLSNMINPAAAGLNPNMQMPMPNLGNPMQTPSLPPSPSTPNANASNPAALGVEADQSNPLKNDMMRKLMIMQFLTKQQGKQTQPDIKGSPGLGGGPMPGGGMMGGGGQVQTAPVNSMPHQFQPRQRFLSGSGFGGGNMSY